jgi:hypothetical protein
VGQGEHTVNPKTGRVLAIGQAVLFVFSGVNITSRCTASWLMSLPFGIADISIPSR